MGKSSLKTILPSGDLAEFQMIDIDAVNQVFATKNPSEQFYKLLESGITIDPEGSRMSYDWKTQFEPNNFAAMICRRRASFGDEFRYQVECSGCDYGKQKGAVGWKKFLTIYLGDQKPEGKVWVDNPNAIRMIQWEEGDSDGKTVFGIDKKSGRFLVYLEDENKTLVQRLLTGADSKQVNKISTYPEYENKKISAMLHLRSVGIVGEEKGDVKDWRKAIYEKPTEEFISKLGYADFKDILSAQQMVDGGVETDFVEFCPVCGNKLITTGTNGKSIIPFLSQDFFSRASRLK